MKKVFTLIVLVELFIISTFAQTPSNDAHWQLVLEDDFANIGYIPSRWVKEIHSTRPYLTYTSLNENIFIDNESLVIKVIKKGTSNYTSGSLKDPNPIMGVSRYYLYGYFEIECKLPSGLDMFPAFWMHGCTWVDSVGCIKEREIDIFEHGWDLVLPPPNPNRNKDPYIHTNGFYWNYNTGELGVSGNYHSVTSNLFINYNKFGVEWSPKILQYIFNDSIYQSYYYHDSIPCEPMAVLMNLDLYGSNPNLSFPSTHEFRIKRIKYYKLACACNQDALITNSIELNNYFHSVKKSITVGGNNIKIDIGKSIVLRATNEIIINGDFEVPLGSELYVITHGCPE